MSADDVSRLLSLLSHELRSPLGVIRGYLRMLDQLGGELTEAQRVAVAAALKASDRATAILEQASRLAQLRRDETTLHPAPTPAGVLAGDLGRLVKWPDDVPGTLVVGSVPEVDLLVDRTPMTQALATLAAASVRAQSGPTTVDVHLRSVASGTQPGVAIDLRVRGEADAAERDVDTTRGGLGLDLPLAAALIAAHGGHIRELRNGERPVGFVVWLPAAS